MANGLSASDIVNVSVNLAPTAAPTENFGSLLQVGSSPVINTKERMREYSSLDQVAQDFGDGPEYQAAVEFFSQSPQPSTLFIGRWAQSATSGVLVGATLSADQQALSNFTSVSGTGAIDVTIDATDKSVTTLDFSGCTTLSGVAALLQTALATASVVYNAVYNRFEVTSNTAGTTSSVSFATGAVATLMGLTSTGATSVSGIAAESMLAAVQACAAASNQWYGLAIAVASPADSDIKAVAAYVEGSKPSKLFVVTTQDAAAMDPTSTTDLAAALQAAKYNHTAVQYSSSSPYAAVSLFARQASVDFLASNSTITLMFKSEPGVTAETISETQAAALKAKNCNVFVNYDNSTAIIQFGTVASGQYIDSIVGCDWLANEMQTALFNVLYTNGKVFQTDPGVNLLVTAAHSVMDEAVNNALVAPGVWTGPKIGPLNSGQTLTSGYFVYAAPVASQSQASRSARKSPPIQVAAKLAGAIHDVDCVINVAQ